MNAIGILTFSVLLVVLLGAPARWAVLAILAGVLYMTLGQGVSVFGVSMYPMRMIILTALLRILARREYQAININNVDTAFLMAFFYRTAVYLLNGNGPAVAAFGLMIDSTLSYFVCRCLLRSVQDLAWLLRALALLLVPYVLLLYLDYSSRFYGFMYIGGEVVHSLRDGLPRCTGSFSHATILGTFGATFIPLYIALFLEGTNRVLAIGGVVLCLAIVFFSNSGGPLTCAALAFIGWMLWGMRLRMHIVRRILLFTAVFTAIGMKAPIWYLPAKISSLTGGDGWHRSYLMDVAFRALDQWWLAGMPILQTKSWFPYTVVTGGADLINYYLDFGIAAGVAAIGLFCLMLVRAFRAIAKSFDKLRATGQGASAPEMYLWALGVILTIHIFNWFGLVYFDQFHNVFLMQLAFLSTLSGRYSDDVERVQLTNGAAMKVSALQSP